jgi:hypothetical protein
MGMELWLRQLSDHFNRMVWQRSPAALIVLAHWCCWSSEPSKCCWFLRGLASKVLSQIAGEPPKTELSRAWSTICWVENGVRSTVSSSESPWRDSRLGESKTLVLIGT